MEPIITSLLDTDLYKYTMQQAVLHRFPGAQAQYRFRCRNRPAYPLSELKPELDRQLDELCALRLADSELAYLGDLRYLKPDYVDFLALFRLQRQFVSTAVVGDELDVIIDGPMLHAMMFEIPILAIVQELYMRRLWASDQVGRQGLQTKLDRLKTLASTEQRKNPFHLFEFGTRRRASRAWQREVVAALVREAPQYLRGTSNVALAREYSLTPIGTMAHEYLQAHQGLGFRLRDFQRAALENWVAEYRGDLGIALTDTVGMRAFLADFDLYFAKLFDGLRHDSGDPMDWGESAIAAYRALRIDPASKRLVFSDSLSLERAIDIYRRFADRIPVAFGIGTQLTADIGIEPLNIVIKMVRCNGQPVAKLSDSPGKAMCEDDTFLAYLRQVFELPGAREHRHG